MTLSFRSIILGICLLGLTLLLSCSKENNIEYDELDRGRQLISSSHGLYNNDSPINEKNICNSDSLKILLRVYPRLFKNDSLIREQTYCFCNKANSAIDIAMCGIARGYGGLALELLDSAIGFIDDSLLSDAYYFKGTLSLDKSYQATILDTILAFDYFDSSLKYNPSYDLALYNKGIIHLAMNNADSANVFIDSAIAIKSNQVHYWIYSGVANNILGNKNIASNSVDSAIFYGNGSGVVFEYIGSELSSNGFHSEAIRLYDSALVTIDDDAGLWFSYGLSNYAMDSSDFSYQYFDSCIKYCDDKNNLLTYGNIISAHRIGHYGNNFYNKSLQIDRNNPWGWLYFSWELAKMDLIDSAIVCLDSAIHYDASNDFINHSLWKGYHLMSYGQFQDALDELNKVNIQDLDSNLKVDQIYYKTYCSAQIGKIEDAVNLCDSLILLSPNDTNIKKFCDSLKLMGN